MARGPNIPDELIQMLGTRALMTMPKYENHPYVVFRREQMTPEQLEELDRVGEEMVKDFKPVEVR